jgi:hypothetical protein
MRDAISSAIWSLGISLPVSLAGVWMSFGLAPMGSFIALIPFLPAVGVLMLFDSTGPFPISSEWQIMAIGLLAQFLGYFVVIHSIRVLRRKGQTKQAD